MATIAVDCVREFQIQNYWRSPQRMVQPSADYRNREIFHIATLKKCYNFRAVDCFFYYYYSAYTRGTSLCFLFAAFLVRNRQTSLHGHTKTPTSWVGSQCCRHYIIVYGGPTKLLLKRLQFYRGRLTESFCLLRYWYEIREYFRIE